MAVFDKIRPTIQTWQQNNLIKGVILTYHSRPPPGDLYICLDIPSLKKQAGKRTVGLPRELREQIPNEITDEIEKICEENNIATRYDPNNPPDKRLIIIDYEYNITENESGKRFYRNAPVEEVLRFASAGTDVALRILEQKSLSRHLHSIDVESQRKLASYIYSTLENKLGKNYFWLREAFHFVCNPLRILDEPILWELATSG